MTKKIYWLRGGLIIFTLYALATIALIPFGNSGGCSFICFPYWSIPTLIPNFMLSSATDHILPNVGHVPGFVFFVIASTFYFIVGVIVGWIYGKIKNRNA